MPRRGRSGDRAEASQIEDVEVMDLLERLVEKSLVGFDQASSRYYLTDTVQQYARGLLARNDAETDAARALHARFCLALAEEAKRELAGPAQGEWLDRLEMESDNLRGALAWARERAERAETALRLASSLQGFWLARGHLAEGRRHIEEALVVADRADSGADVPEFTTALARTLGGAGLLASATGNPTEAEAYHERALALFAAAGHELGVSASYGNLGNLAYSRGEYARARELFENGLAVQRRLGDRLFIAISLYNLSSVARAQGDLDAARAYLRESMALRRELGDHMGVAAALNEMGRLAHLEGDYVRAEALYEESLGTFRELGNRQSAAVVLQNLADLALARGDVDRSRAFSEESLELRRAVGDRRGIADTLTTLGDLAIARGEWGTARSLYTECMEIQQVAGERLGIAYSLYNLAEVTRREDLSAEARSLYSQSAETALELGDDCLLAYLLEAWVALWAASGDAARGARLAGAASRQREVSAAARLPEKTVEWNAALERLRAMLGEERFAEEWARGAAMSLTDALDDARGAPPSREAES